MTWFHKISWAVTSAITTLAVFITIFYWSIIFAVGENSYFNVFVHGLNSVIVIVDLAVVAKPYKFQHLFMPVAIGIL